MTSYSPHPAPRRPCALLDDEDAAAVARALSHPVRIRILRILAGRNECYCGDLCQEFALAQSTVSQHLKVLKEAGLVRATPCGTAVGYCVEEERLAAFHGWVEALDGAVRAPSAAVAAADVAGDSSGGAGAR